MQAHSSVRLVAELHLLLELLHLRACYLSRPFLIPQNNPGIEKLYFRSLCFSLFAAQSRFFAKVFLQLIHLYKPWCVIE